MRKSDNGPSSPALPLLMSSPATSPVIDDNEVFRPSARRLLIQALIDHGAHDLKALVDLKEKVISARSLSSFLLTLSSAGLERRTPRPSLRSATKSS
jgi:hypothetical protein